LNEERFKSTLFWIGFGSTLFFSTLPALYTRQLFWSIPFCVAILHLLVMRDMYAIKKDIQSLESKRYKFKGV
jgi:hypothetical protein